MYIHIYIWICICIYIYIYTHTHANDMLCYVIILLYITIMPTVSTPNIRRKKMSQFANGPVLYTHIYICIPMYI